MRKQILPPRPTKAGYGERARDLSISLAYALAKRVEQLKQVSECNPVLYQTRLESDEAPSFFDDIPMIEITLHKK